MSRSSEDWSVDASPLGERNVERYSGESRDTPAMRGLFRSGLGRFLRSLGSRWAKEGAAGEKASDLGSEAGELGADFVVAHAERQKVANKVKRAEIAERMASVRLKEAEARKALSSANESDASAEVKRTEAMLNKVKAVEMVADLLAKDLEGKLAGLLQKYGDVEVAVVDGRLIVTVGIEPISKDDQSRSP